MRFHLLPMLALAASVRAQASASTVTSNIDDLSQLSTQTNDMAKSITIVNLFNTTPKMISGLHDIIRAASKYSSSMEKRQDCINFANPEQCVQDVGQVVDNPDQALGSSKKRTQGKQRRASPSYSDADQDAICSSYRSFVQIEQQLLQTVVSKHGFLSLTPYAQPIAASLRTLEGSDDQFSYNIVDAVPNCAQDANENKKNLDKSLSDAVDTYSD